MSVSRSLSRFVTALSLAALLVPAAEAQTTRQLRLTSAGNVPFGNVLVGPYRGMLYAEPGTPTIDIYCVDFLNGISVGTQWTARVTAGNANLSQTRLGALYSASPSSFFGASSAATRYRQAAWLTTQFAIQNTSAWGGIHAAIWMLTTPNPGSALPSSFTTAAQYWLGQAGQNYARIETDDYVILTDSRTINGVGGVQEYVTLVTPEPASMILLGTGLAGMAGVRAARRRKEKQNDRQNGVG